MSSTNELRQRISSEIVAQLKSGGLPPWKRPWALDPNCGSPRNIESVRAYRGINVLLLDLSAMKRGYRSRWWGTYRQIQQLHGHVRRGEKATHIILFRPLIKTRTTDDGEEVEERIPIMRTFCVFNAEQTEGLEYLWAGRTELAPAIVEDRYKQADAAIAATKAEIRHGGNDAFFSLSGDFIQMPFPHQFPNRAHYLESLCHELIHWTGPAHRLNWDRATKGYATGELVAEVGASFLAGELGIPTGEGFTNHVSYMEHWIKRMQSDPKFIFQISADASKAVDYLLSFSRKVVEQPEEVVAE